MIEPALNKPSIISAFDRIGEENAFAVLARAGALAAEGKDIINLGIGVSEQIDPPGANCIKITFSIKIIKPYSLTPINRDKWQYFMLFHLRTWVPNSLQTAFY